MSVPIEMSITAVDKASDTLSKVANQVGTLDKATSGMGTTTQAVTRNWGDAAVKAQNLATVGIALYGSIDRIQNSQLALEKANLMVARATESAESAQKKYNEAVEKYGPNSEEAKKAADALAIAQEALRLKTESAGQAQQNANMAYVQMGMSIIPLATTAITSIRGVMAALSITTNLSTVAQTALNTAMMLCPYIALAAGIIAIVAYLYQVTEGFTNWTTVIQFFTDIWERYLKPALTALWNMLQPIVNLLNTALSAVSALSTARVSTPALSAPATPTPALPKTKVPSLQGITSPVTFTEPSLALLHPGETVMPAGEEFTIHNYIVLDGRVVAESVSRRSGEKYRYSAGSPI